MFYGTATVTGHWQYHAGLMYTPFSIEDGGDRVVEITPIQTGNDRGMVLVEVRFRNTRQLVFDAQIQPAEGTKLVGASGELRGTLLLLTLGAIKPGPGDPEDLYREEFPLDLSGLIVPIDYGSGGGGGGGYTPPLLPAIRAEGQTFTDVDRANPFFEGIEGCVGMHLFAGYSDGTFRPNAQLTRGQFAKAAWNLARFLSGQ